MAECEERLNRKEIVFKDRGNNRCRMIFLNPNQREVTRIRVDGCKITEGKRCDFMLVTDTEENYIELKGKNVSYACKQIEATIEKLSSDVKKHPKHGFIICTVVPKVSGSIQKTKKKFKKDYNSSLST